VLSMQQKHMGNVPSPKQQKEYEETLSTVTRASQGAPQDLDEKEDLVDPMIADRMLARVLIFAGAPVVVGLLLFPFFYWLKVTTSHHTALPTAAEAGNSLICILQVVQKVELPMGLVFVVQSITFGAGLLGITYGATSASWDPRRKGSALGWNEFKANLSAIMNKNKQ
jgi:hypothetical protein